MEKDIKDAVIDYWESQTMYSFKERYNIWKERQKKCGRSDNTIYKYETDYVRFFEGNIIEKMKVQDINDKCISEFILRLLKRKEIPYKALKAMYGYMKGVFDKCIIDNPLTSEMEEVLLRVKKVELANGFLTEFVFSNENGRIHAGTISSAARNRTMSKEFVNAKSIHAIRRTLNSNLRCNGMSATVAASILGHTEKVNEENYTYDVSDMAYKTHIIASINKKTAQG